MNARVVMLVLSGMSLAGCQVAGPGVRVQVCAEPKQGYAPPSAADPRYPSSIDVSADDAHDQFQLIDYRRLEGIVVCMKPNAYTADAGVSTDQPPPLNANVEVSRSKPARLEDFALASIGGRVTLSPAALDRGGAYILRTEDGELIELSSSDLVFPPRRPGFVEILSDDGDEPIGAFYVAPTSWAKKLRSGERVTFAPLQQGIYVVSAWHPILPGSEAMVQVTADKVSKLTLKIGVNSLPKPTR